MPAGIMIMRTQGNLCSGCGVCAGVCPSKCLAMAEASNGDLIPRWTDGPCTSDCGVCLAVCPFSNGVFDPRALNEELYSPKAKAGQDAGLFHEDVGYFDSAFVGYSEINRPTSASGGLLSWTLENLIASAEIDRAAVVVCIPDNTKGYRFIFREARTALEVRQGAGSVYHQVEISDLLRKIASEPGLRWAVTGVPCMCAALRQAMRSSPKIAQSIRYVFGLACGMYQNRFYTEMLLAKSGLDFRTTSMIEYRRKSLGAAPSDFRFRGTDNHGNVGREIAYSGLPVFLGRNAFFRINACNFCKDVFAETADACFMDAWLPEYHREWRGSSLVLVRNVEIRNLLLKGREENTLSLDEISIEQIVASQKGHVRRKRYLIEMRQGKSSDRATGRSFPFEDRWDWLIQRWAQRRSKTVWRALGRRYGIWAFWITMVDVLLLIAMKKLYRKTISRVFRFTARRKSAEEVSA